MTDANSYLAGITFAIGGLVFMAIVPLMLVRSLYAQTPRRFRRTFGRISAWLMVLGTEAIAFALLIVGMEILLDGIDRPITSLDAAMVRFFVPYGMLYLLAAVVLAAAGALTMFAGRIINGWGQQRGQNHL